MSSRRKAGRATRALSRLAIWVTVGALAAAATVAINNPGPEEISPAQAFGPVAEEYGGFPGWVDDNGTIDPNTGQQARFELCLDQNDARCIAGFRPNSAGPIEFPGNFPDEAFWWAAAAILDTGAGSAGIETAVEAAFVNGDPAPGDQMAFSRLRIRIDTRIDGDYTVTTPYGVEGPFTADAGIRTINSTIDIGALSGGVFDPALSGDYSRFLVWTDGPDRDALELDGYLADPAVPHTVEGAVHTEGGVPFNKVRIAGPPGAFLGSTAAACPGVIDDSCIETDQFFVQAKLAQNYGVQITRVAYSEAGTTDVLDVFAVAGPNQDLQVSGDGFGTTAMTGDGLGNYYARIEYVTRPSEVTVVNTSDAPHTKSTALVDQDTVRITSADYDGDLLTVAAESDDPAAILSLVWPGPGVVDTSVAGVFTVTGVTTPPAEVTVSSTLGGSDTEQVRLDGPAKAPLPVKAIANVAPSGQKVQANTEFYIDGSSSIGNITMYDWSQTTGPSTLIEPVNPGDWSLVKVTAPDLGPTGGELVFRLEVTDIFGSKDQSEDIVVAVQASGQAPVANAGLDQGPVAPFSTVTLDGTGSDYAVGYSWTQVGGPTVINLQGESTSRPTFVVPPGDGSEPIVFELVVSNGQGSSDPATVQVTIDPDEITSVLRAEYRASKTEWRVEGTVKFCAAANAVSVYLVRSGVETLVGTATPLAGAGTCDWALRVRGNPAGRNGDTLTIKSAYGAVLSGVTLTVR